MENFSKDILEQAKNLFWAQTESWTGHRWNWDEVSKDVQEKFINHAKNNTKPWSKEMSKTGTKP